MIVRFGVSPKIRKPSETPGGGFFSKHHASENFGSGVLTQIGRRKEYKVTPHYTERDAEAVFRGRSNSNCN